MASGGSSWLLLLLKLDLNSSQVEEFERVEQERLEERKLATKKILERMRQEDALRLESRSIFSSLWSMLIKHVIIIECQIIIRWRWRLWKWRRGWIERSGKILIS